MFIVRILTVVCLLGGPSLALADLDPELAAANPQNDGGFFLGGNLNFGQSYATGGSNPGLAYLLSIEPGYVSTRDTWGRIETSLEVGIGQMSYREKNSSETKVTIAMNGLILAKVGYGINLRKGTFAILRVGAGPALATYRATAGGTTVEASANGLAAQIAYDFVIPASDKLDIVAGLELTHVALDTAGGSVESLNIPAANAGARFKF
jgi:hypothetical protein